MKWAVICFFILSGLAAGYFLYGDVLLQQRFTKTTHQEMFVKVGEPGMRGDEKVTPITLIFSKQPFYGFIVWSNAFAKFLLHEKVTKVDAKISYRRMPLFPLTVKLLSVNDFNLQQPEISANIGFISGCPDTSKECNSLAPGQAEPELPF